MKIPHFNLSRQYENLKQELLDATDSALKSGQLVSGEYTKKFEDWLKNKCSAKYAVTVHSGTQALEIIATYKKEYHLTQFNTAPTVRIPNITYPATLNAFLKADWNVELADTDKYGILLDNEEPSPGVYDCYVGLYGRFPHYNKQYSETFNIMVDGAQHWLVCDGNIGSGMAISFDPTKNLPSSGNGGAIVTNNQGLYSFAVNYRDNCKLANFKIIGTNSKISEQDAAQLLVRTKYIDEWQKRREKIAKYYMYKFKNLPIKCLSNDLNTPHAYQKFVIYTDYRHNFIQHLTDSGVEIKKQYDYVLSELPVTRNIEKPTAFSTSFMLSRGVVSLPIYPELSDNEVEYIAKCVLDLYENSNYGRYYT